MAGLVDPRTAFGQQIDTTPTRKKYATPLARMTYNNNHLLKNLKNINDDNNVDEDTKKDVSGSGSAASSYSQSLFDYFKEKNEKARQSSLNAVLAKLKMGEKQYNANLDNITDQYQALRNQSEVERYKSQRAMREALANRGQLDSGLGRQEQLEMDTQYGNAINSLNSQEAKAKGEVRNLIAQLRAEAELEKANIENQYNTAIQNFKTQMGS